MAKNTSIPMYLVRCDLDDAESNEAVTIESAKSYVATLDSFGIPAWIQFVYSLSPDEFLERR